MKIKTLIFFGMLFTMVSCGSDSQQEEQQAAEDSIATEQLNEIIEIDSTSIELNSEVQTLDSEVDEILKGLEE